MIFSLEALEAKHGDCLILHYGDENSPRFAVIDGGPVGVYKGRLKPRLGQIKDRWQPEGPLPIQLLMVSHIDEDHINGVLALTADLVGRRELSQPLPYRVLTLWHNSFDDIVGNGSSEVASSVAGAASAADVMAGLPPGINIKRETAAVVASVGQGRQLRDNARLLSIPVNSPFAARRLIMAPDDGPRPFDFDDVLRLTVLAPSKQRVRDLHKAWEKALLEAKAKGDPNVVVAAFSDESVFNLSSIVVLAECGGKRVLLTGDARGDHILEGLDAAPGLLTDGKIHVDVLKMPHHGSDRNVDVDFFQRITADHYVISANGRDHNPDEDTLQMIAKARGKVGYTIHLTNRDGKLDLGERLTLLLDEDEVLRERVAFRDEDAASLRIDLLSPVTY